MRKIFLILRKGAKSQADVTEAPVRRQDIGDPEFDHERHRRKISKRYSWLVGKLSPQFNRLEKSRLCDFLHIYKGRPNHICREVPGIVKWPAFEQQREGFIQNEIRRDGAARTAGASKNFGCSFVARVSSVRYGHPAPRVHKKFQSEFSPYNSSSIFWDNVPSEMDPITLRNGS